jgi:hypothetical protein
MALHIIQGLAATMAGIYNGLMAYEAVGDGLGFRKIATKAIVSLTSLALAVSLFLAAHR